MARPIKQTVDYFPHLVLKGKTKLILQNEFGNDGYAFWFQLLELLCLTENQVYDYNNPASWRLLLAETHVTEDSAVKILQLLADLGAIDFELHKSKIIWSQNLVENLELVYKRRSTGKPEKPVIANKNTVNANNNRHTRQDNTRQDNTRQDKATKKQSISQKFGIFWKAYPKKKSKGQAEKAFYKINPDEQLLATMLATIERATKSADWLEENGRYIPYPVTWLNAKGWEDEFPSKKGEPDDRIIREQTQGRRPWTYFRGDEEPGETGHENMP